MRTAMKSAAAAVVLALAGVPAEGRAQDLVVTNARVIDGTGRTLEKVSVVVTGGRISAVSSERVDPGAARVIDARGMTVLPGFIDVHRHDLLGTLRDFAGLSSDAEVAAAVVDGTPERMRMLLDEGFTTVMIPGMFLSAATDVRRRLERGEFAAPRVLSSGPGFAAPDDFPVKGMVCGDNAYCSERVAFEVTGADEARGHVRTLAAAGVDAIKILIDNKGNDLDAAVIAAIADEAGAQGLPAYLHAHRVEDMMKGVRTGVDRLVHMPSDALVADVPAARLMRERGVAIATAASYTAPAFAEAMGFPYSAAAAHERLLANVRHLVDEGVTVAFGTDSPDGVRPMVEIKELSRVLTPGEIITALTRDAAKFLNLDDTIGTIETGKVADLVIVQGNPLDDVAALGRVKVVIQAGAITADHRESR